MASATDSHHHHSHSLLTYLPRLIQSTTSNVVSLLTADPNPKSPCPPSVGSTALPATSSTLPSISTTSKLFLPLPLTDSPITHLSLSSPSESTLDDSLSANSSHSSAISSGSSVPAPGFPSAVRVGSLSSAGKGSGPAFVGQVFSMCDLTGTGLMAVSTHFDIPFISKGTAEWVKKIFSSVVKSEDGPVFRFFMDLGDAVSYVKQLNIPSGIVGACRLDLAYEHFKEKPHLFQFVPNEKQVKAANKLLKRIPGTGVKRRVDGVPVFSAENLDIAIATTEGIKWYTPYFFDIRVLDKILDESVDQHFHSLIQSRHIQRRRDVIDDNIPAEVVEESVSDNMLESTEMQELLDEVGHPGIPLSVISKAVEMQLLYAVDRLLLGNRWLRKATGIQPKIPYMVDSFERRSAASLLRASKSLPDRTNLDKEIHSELPIVGSSELEQNVNSQASHLQPPDLRLPFGDWFRPPWSQQHQPKNMAESRMGSSPEECVNNCLLCSCRMGSSPEECVNKELKPSPLLPKITMVGISTNEPGQVTKANIKKTMEELTEELEHEENGNPAASSRYDYRLNSEVRDPLFVANVGDYYSGMGKTSSARWVRGGSR